MYILSALAQNRPGVIAKASNLLRRKLVNIESLTAGTTHVKGVSKLTIVIKGTKEDAQKAQKMIQKIVEVIEVKLLDESDFVVREIVLARLCIHDEAEYEKLKKAENNIFIRELEVSGNQLLVEIIDTAHQIDSFLDQLTKDQIEIMDWTRSGVIAL